MADFSELVFQVKSKKAINDLKDVQNKLQDVNTKANNLHKTLISAFSLGLLTNVISKSVKSFEAIKQQARTFGIIFKNSIKEANKGIDDLVKNFDHTTESATRLMNIIGTRLSNLQIDPTFLAKASTGIAKISQEMSRVYGENIDQVIQKFTLAMNGMTRGLKQYGIQIDTSSQSFNEQIKQLQLLNGLTYENAKAQAIFNEITKQTNFAMGTFKETAFDLNNALGNLDNTLKSKVLTSMGATFSSIFLPLINLLNDFLSIGNGAVGKILGFVTAFGAIPALMGALTVAAKSILPYLKGIGSGFLIFGKSIKSLFTIFIAFGKSAKDAYKTIINMTNAFKLMKNYTGKITLPDYNKEIKNWWDKFNFIFNASWKNFKYTMEAGLEAFKKLPLSGKIVLLALATELISIIYSIGKEISKFGVEGIFERLNNKIQYGIYGTLEEIAEKLYGEISKGLEDFNIKIKQLNLDIKSIQDTLASLNVGNYSITTSEVLDKKLKTIKQSIKSLQNIYLESKKIYDEAMKAWQTPEKGETESKAKKYARLAAKNAEKSFKQRFLEIEKELEKLGTDLNTPTLGGFTPDSESQKVRKALLKTGKYSNEELNEKVRVLRLEKSNLEKEADEYNKLTPLVKALEEAGKNYKSNFDNWVNKQREADETTIAKYKSLADNYERNAKLFSSYAKEKNITKELDSFTNLFEDSIKASKQYYDLWQLWYKSSEYIDIIDKQNAVQHNIKMLEEAKKELKTDEAIAEVNKQIEELKLKRNQIDQERYKRSLESLKNNYQNILNDIKSIESSNEFKIDLDKQIKELGSFGKLSTTELIKNIEDKLKEFKKMYKFMNNKDLIQAKKEQINRNLQISKIKIDALKQEYNAAIKFREEIIKIWDKVSEFRNQSTKAIQVGTSEGSTYENTYASKYVDLKTWFASANNDQTTIQNKMIKIQQETEKNTSDIYNQIKQIIPKISNPISLNIISAI